MNLSSFKDDGYVQSRLQCGASPPHIHEINDFMTSLSSPSIHILSLSLSFSDAPTNVVITFLFSLLLLSLLQQSSPHPTQFRVGRRALLLVAFFLSSNLLPQ